MTGSDIGEVRGGDMGISAAAGVGEGGAQPLNGDPLPGDAATMVKVEEQIALAKKEHEAGNHDASIVAAKEAWKLLGM